jgi:hypothetical protein
MAVRIRKRVAGTVLIVLLAALAVDAASRAARQVSAAAHQAVAAWGNVGTEFKARAGMAPALADLARRLDPTREDLAARITAAGEAVERLTPDPATPYAPDRFHAFMDVQDALSVPLGHLLDLVNAHPIEANDDSVKAVLARLAGHEQRIVVARSDYVARARAYNAELDGIPNRWTVSFFHPDASLMVASFDFSAKGSGVRP